MQKITKSLIFSAILILLTLKSFSQNPAYPIGHTEVSTVTWNVRNFIPATTVYGRKFMTMYDSTKFSFLISRIGYDSLWLKRTGVNRSFLVVDSVTKECKLVGENMLGLKKATITNALGFTPIAMEIDGDPSNEVQTLSVSSNSLTISGGNTVVLPTSPTIGAPSTGNAITSGTAFQPRSGGPCNILVSTTLGAGVVGLRGTSVIALSSTQNGTYTDIGPGTSFAITILNVADNRDGITVPVPAGWWVRVTNTATGLGATLTSTYTRWDL